ncbi:hypothetical protein JCM16814_25060 [Desulfobaculum senezii]
MPELFMDCGFGIAGDMFLAASAGLGVDVAPVETALREVGVDVRVRAEETRATGLVGMRLVVEGGADQPLRHLSEIIAISSFLQLGGAVCERAAQAFIRLAEVEAAVHGIPVDQVHFHEVGAVDTLVDVVGAFYALEALGVTRVVSSPLPWFTGRVQCAHGTLGLPAPATLELLRGKPVYPTAFRQEIITPTGALILDSVTDHFASGPEGVVAATGTGYGTHDLGPGNVGLRLMLVDEWQGAPAGCGAPQ